MNHQAPFLCCLLKCCPKYRKGTIANRIENAGRRAPHGPMPPLSSFQIALKTPKGVAPADGFESTVTASSVVAMIVGESHSTNN